MNILYIIIAFTAIPIVELILLILIHRNSSMLFTVSLILVTGLIGSFLAKRQGTSNYKKIKESFKSGQLPGKELLHGLLILIAGALLITPGVMTDILGFLLLTPPFRSLIGGIISKKIKSKFKVQSQGFNFTQSYNSNTNDDIIDVVAEDSDINDDQLSQ